VCVSTYCLGRCVSCPRWRGKSEARGGVIRTPGERSVLVAANVPVTIRSTPRATPFSAPSARDSAFAVPVRRHGSPRFSAWCADIHSVTFHSTVSWTERTFEDVSNPFLPTECLANRDRAERPCRHARRTGAWHSTHPGRALVVPTPRHEGDALCPAASPRRAPRPIRKINEKVPLFKRIPGPDRLASPAGNPAAVGGRPLPGSCGSQPWVGGSLLGVDGERVETLLE
jgi:hypothetical protein